MREQQKVIIVDLNGLEPVVTPTADLDQLRIWSNVMVLADGKVLVNGGSAVDTQLTGVAYAAAIRDPVTGQWTLGASAVKPRLYHSTALLLPDGSVLTAGGGAPGPVNNLNAEIVLSALLVRCIRATGCPSVARHCSRLGAVAPQSAIRGDRGERCSDQPRHARTHGGGDACVRTRVSGFCSWASPRSAKR